MANNKTKVEVMAISVLTTRSSTEDMSPSVEKKDGSQKIAAFCCFIMGRNKMKNFFIGAVMALGTVFSSVSLSFADELLVPTMSYRVGPYAANGTMVANGFVDYFEMLNERDGGIGGVKINAEECETGYKAQVALNVMSHIEERTRSYILPIQPV